MKLQHGSVFGGNWRQSVGINKGSSLKTGPNRIHQETHKNFQRGSAPLGSSALWKWGVKNCVVVQASIHFRQETCWWDLVFVHPLK